MTKEMQTQLRVLAAETRPTACLGCGFEHNCTLRGCAVLNTALQNAKILDALETLRALEKQQGVHAE